MRMSNLACAAGLALALGGCGKEEVVEEVPATLAAGLYELSAEVTDFGAVGEGAPVTNLKLGDKGILKACIAADGKPQPDLFAEQQGDDCNLFSSYVRNGRINAQLKCGKGDLPGSITHTMNGQFKADSFEGEIKTASYFRVGANYRMTRKVSAKRVGDCPAAPAEKSAA